MYSARVQSRAAGGCRRPDLLLESRASRCNPVDSWEPASFPLPSSFEKNLATSHLSLFSVPRGATVPPEGSLHRLAPILCHSLVCSRIHWDRLGHQVGHRRRGTWRAPSRPLTTHRVESCSGVIAGCAFNFRPIRRLTSLLSARVPHTIRRWSWLKSGASRLKISRPGWGVSVAPSFAAWSQLVGSLQCGRGSAESTKHSVPAISWRSHIKVR